MIMFIAYYQATDLDVLTVSTQKNCQFPKRYEWTYVSRYNVFALLMSVLLCII